MIKGMSSVPVKGVVARVIMGNISEAEFQQKMMFLLNQNLVGSDFVRELERIKKEYMEQYERQAPVKKVMRSYHLYILDPSKDKEFTTMCDVWIGHRLNMPTAVVSNTSALLSVVRLNKGRGGWVVYPNTVKLGDDRKRLEDMGCKLFRIPHSNNAAITVQKTIYRKLFPSSRFSNVISDPAFRTLWSKLIGGINFDEAFMEYRQSAGEEARRDLAVPRKKRTIKI